MMKRILVGLGSLEYARSATAKAIELAKVHDAELTGVTLLDIDRLDDLGPIPMGAGDAARELKESRIETAKDIIRTEQEEFAKACEKAGVTYRLQSELGDPLSALVSLTRYHDLVICGLQSFFEHGVVDEPVDELAKLVQEGIRPLLAVAEKDRQINKVLVSYSGSMESAKTIKQYAHLRLWPKAKMKIVTFHDDREIGAERLSEIAQYCRAHGYEPETECVAKPPIEALLPYANEWGADLIVLGNSSKSLLLRRILGETALHVMRNSALPLFLAQ
ncbi:universal stress protein [Bythopirellula polymerisocia]|uniref:Universal stress protein family protein n=1 Tax=Bythopirellula polymerisocia TaxID=2528003 RepID=A0A5C6CSE2_9BACT|nr:universal stress protein [Bythopirellula polymerisocia]TWU27470.1 Universal stress protein family protein [Bythopirellula polymerisocia]